MYADDTTIYFHMEELSGIYVEVILSNELIKVNNELSLNALSLNTDKIKCMTFHTWQENIDPLSFSIYGGKNTNCQVIFDDNLTWKNHSTMLTNKHCIFRSIELMHIFLLFMTLNI